ncbi:MAG: hypothetical protein FJ399_07910, partial [Verrucomicrobia bacterium]|nr:hypothetical protein [Verrucomicrobiota bacterium]
MAHYRCSVSVGLPFWPRRRFAARILRKTLLLLALALTRTDGATGPAAIAVGAGPQLFIDDHLIAEQSFLTRTVNRPAKLPDPII